MIRHHVIAALALLAPLQPAPAKAPPPPLAPGAQYVAMGSSYAAGPGVGQPAGGPARCARGTLSYPERLAKDLSLTLVNVTCSGSTTEHILGPWNELPAQIDAITADTRLVTITSGGNDIGFVRNLYAAACAARTGTAPTTPCPTPRIASDAEWQAVEQRMHDIARVVHQRAPMARLVFVDYAMIVPSRGACPQLAGTPAELAASRATARRLAAMTARVARAEGAMLLPASALTQQHTPCAAEPWSFGSAAPAGAAPLHPGEQAHAAISKALAKRLGATR